MNITRLNVTIGALAAAALVATANAQCDASFTFADFSAGGGPLADLNIVGDATLQSSALRLTPAVGGQRGAAWYQLSRSSVGDGFSTTFQFRVSNGSADGFAFVIQNQSDAALGGGGSGMGYASNDASGITRSVAIEIDTFGFSDEFPIPHISIQSDGNNENQFTDNFSLAHADVGYSLDDGQLHQITITYSPGEISVSLDNGAVVLIAPLDLHDVMGSDILFDGDLSECAWIGFTGSTGAAVANQDIISWSFDDTARPPECRAGFSYTRFDTDLDALTLVNDAQLNGDTLTLTSSLSGQRGAAWYTQSRASVGNGFSTDFTFRISNGCADGFAFVVQNESPFAIGTTGSGMGYGEGQFAGITRSLAVEFDTFGFSDEFATDHISLQTNGNLQNRTSDDNSLASLVLEGLSLCDGAVHSVRIEYVPGLMSVVIDNGPALTAPIDLRSLNGDDILADGTTTRCAWVGFTGATGGATATQEILSWTYNDAYAGGCATPRLMLNPDFGARNAFQRAEYNAVVVGSAPLTYSWILNGTPLENDGRISGATTSQLIIDPLRSADAGQLDIMISNACGSTSTGGELYVLCYADFNQDGGVDGSDVTEFFRAWSDGDPAADVDFSGGVDGSDVDVFFVAWSEGGC